MEAQAITIDQPFHAAYEKFIEITSHLSPRSEGDQTHSEIEAYLETDGRELLRLLLQDHVDQQGGGRVGAAVCGSDGVVRSHKRDHMETGYHSVFGAIRVARTGSSRPGASSLFPRDAQLNLPAQSSSHRLQKRVAAKAAKMSFESVASDIACETGVRIGQRHVEEIVSGAAQDFDTFSKQACPDDLQRQAAATPILVLTFDGKGVVMRKEALRDETRKRADARAPKAPGGFYRQDKSNRKRMATVASISHIDRHVRTPHTVAQSCAPLRLVPQPRPVVPKPVGKTLWASLDKSMQTVSETGFAEGKRRDPTQQAAWVVLVDGDLTQISDIEQTARSVGVEVVIIVDIIHALEYLWKAAKAWLPPDDPNGGKWVGDTPLQRLQGEVKSIVRNVRRGATAKRMTSKQREPIDQCVTSLATHAAYLHYPTYLANGSPIATGVIEGGCRSLVKDRMEITGARWGLPGGEAVLKLRALVINGDFDAYWDFHEQQEYNRHHRSKFSEMPSVRPRLQLISGGKDG